MANTTNLNLVKPAGTDKALVSVLNSNSDKIDAFAGTTNQAISNIRQNEIVIPITENTDLNTLTTPGYYNLYGAKSLVNAPASGANRLGLLVQKAESTQYVYQMAFDNVNDATGVYVRSCKGGTWSAWQQLGLNADAGMSNNLPDLNNKPNGVYGFGISSAVTVDSTSIPSGTRFSGYLGSSIGQFSGISPSGTLYIIRCTGSTWSWLKTIS